MSDFLNYAQDKNALAFKETFEERVAAKVSDVLDGLKSEVAASLFASDKEVSEEVESIDESDANVLNRHHEKLDNMTDPKKIKSHIANMKTGHLQYLHHFNMGQSGVMEHPVVKHITAELRKRKSLKYNDDKVENMYSDKEVNEDAVNEASYLNKDASGKTHYSDAGSFHPTDAAKHAKTHGGTVVRDPRSVRSRLVKIK